MKSTLLLSTALFLISAPAPDSRDIAEITSNFIVPDDVPGLMAAEQAPAAGSLKSDDPRDVNALLHEVQESGSE